MAGGKSHKLFAGMSQASKHRDSEILKESEYIEKIDPDKILPNPYQPRKHFDEETLKTLSDNIKEHGQDTPIVVNYNNDGSYTLIAGERRLRAVKLANLKSIRAIIQNYNDSTMRKKALWENIHREDLTDFEKYESIKGIKDEDKIPDDKKLSAHLNIAYSTLRRIMSFDKLSEEVLEVYKNSAKPISTSIIERLSTVEETIALPLLETIITKEFSKKQAIEYINSVVKENNPPKIKSSREINSFYKFNCNEKKINLRIDRAQLSIEANKELDDMIEKIQLLLQNEEVTHRE